MGETEPYFGRNYWVEVKGLSSDVTFIENLGLFNSGGIQFWDEGNIENVFTDITVSDNIFANFINADPSGLLDENSGASRHKSGIVGGLVWSTEDDSSSSGLIVTGNTIDADLEQWVNQGDLASLIYVVGAAGDAVNISNNDLNWTFEAEGVPEVDATAAILIARELLSEGDNLTVNIANNLFSHDDVSGDESYASVALELMLEAAGAANQNVSVNFSDNTFEGYSYEGASLLVARLTSDTLDTSIVQI